MVVRCEPGGMDAEKEAYLIHAVYEAIQGFHPIDALTALSTVTAMYLAHFSSDEEQAMKWADNVSNSVKDAIKQNRLLMAKPVGNG